MWHVLPLLAPTCRANLRLATPYTLHLLAVPRRGKKGHEGEGEGHGTARQVASLPRLARHEGAQHGIDWHGTDTKGHVTNMKHAMPLLLTLKIN